MADVDAYGQLIMGNGQCIPLARTDLQEAASQYKWYTSQYVTFMAQYNQGIGIKYKQPKQQKEEPKRRRKDDE